MYMSIIDGRLDLGPLYVCTVISRSPHWLPLNGMAAVFHFPQYFTGKPVSEKHNTIIRSVTVFLYCLC